MSVRVLGICTSEKSQRGIFRCCLPICIDIATFQLLYSFTDFSHELLTAQCFVFFIAGFETSSSTLSFILYLLAEHPDVQRKLQNEVDLVLEKHDGEITYEALREMHYMEKVFNGRRSKLLFVLREIERGGGDSPYRS